MIKDICAQLLAPITSKIPVVVFDLDNTLADMRHRLYLRAEKDFVGFYAACVNDTPMNNIIELVKFLYAKGVRIEIWSCRSAAVRLETEKQLADWGVPYDRLLLRPARDWRKGPAVKTDWYSKFITENPKSCIALAFDDQDDVLDMWRALNVRSLKVTLDTYSEGEVVCPSFTPATPSEGSGISFSLNAGKSFSEAFAGTLLLEMGDQIRLHTTSSS